MPRFLVLALAAAALATSISSAETIIPGGNVSGLWNVAGSPYLIQGNIIIPANETLLIDPGVSVIFQGVYAWTVEGWLEAIGTVTDSILITCQDTTARWYGIYLDHAPDSSRFEYCVIEYAKAWPLPSEGSSGIYAYHSHPVISHCTLRYNQGKYGGAIRLVYSHARITNNEIFRNGREDVTAAGGGIMVQYMSFPSIAFNTLQENLSEYGGGGIEVDKNSIAHIYSNFFIGNWVITDSWGGGLEITGGAQPQGCVFVDNSCGGRGGGVGGENIQFHKNVAYHNSANDVGGGFYDGYQCTIDNSILWSNSPDQISVLTPTSFSNIQNGWPGIGNIDSDPLFVAPEYYDFRLQWGSPCIDAGDPDQQNNDPDGTRGDIGPFYYDQSVPVRILLTPHERNIVIPASGGSFAYTLWLTNIDPANPTFTVWTDVTRPDGSVFGPVVGPIMTQLDSGQTLSRVRSQSVPIGAPRGLYSYNAYAVIGTDTSRDSFNFFNIGAGNWSLVADGWSNTGEEFGEAQKLLITHNSSLITSLSPNPFNPTTAISFELRAASFASLKVFNTSGQRVATLVDGWREAGVHEVTFDGSKLASGIYLARFEAGEFAAVQKLVLMK
jgi:hypothetical protein